MLQYGDTKGRKIMIWQNAQEPKKDHWNSQKNLKLSPTYQYMTVKNLQKIWAARLLENCLIRNL
jgi:hypothetical protein